MKSNRRYLKDVLILIGLSCIFFILGNNILSLTNPDEVFYVQTAKEMVHKNSWMTPYLFGAPQFEKPILTYWLLRFAFLLFGISAFSARLFPAIFATLGVVAVYFLGLLGLRDRRKAMLSALILMSCGFYIGLARTVFTDMIFSVFILFSLLSFFWAYSRQQMRRAGLFLFFIFAGLAVLTKGPLGVIIPLGIVLVFLIVKRDTRFFLRGDFLWGILLFCLISLPWYILMIKTYGSEFIYEFFYNDHLRRLAEAEHISNDTWFFYPLLGLGSMFPWCIYVLFSFVFLLRRLKESTSPIYVFLACWILSVFAIFQVAHSKLVSYIFPLFPALALMTGDFISGALADKKRRSFFFICLGTCLFLLSIPIGLIVASRYYKVYLSSASAVFIFAVIFLIYLLCMLFFLFRQKFLIFLYLLMFQVPLLLSFSFLMHKDYEPFVSCKKACSYLVENYNPENTILCSKFFVRSVRYFTDRKVAVIDINGEGFFSPHPIPFFSKAGQVRDFLRGQDVTYCVLRKSTFSSIDEIIGEAFTHELLKIIGDEYLVRITPLK